ncbi:hypothetical protein OC846_001796 [Tilletia horrida]|uniref:Uncharacterized protein n=1 Tax=Tilletia horrida TaxID=155126 RepID=A0AAN6JVL6_9BASI|nr:hypothetical protein OC846_001796 [Tilletia horrida]
MQSSSGHAFKRQGFPCDGIALVVHTVDVSLSRLDQYIFLFNQYPDLAQDVRFVRIIDDPVTTSFLHRDHILSDGATEISTSAAHPPSAESLSAARWKQLGDLIKTGWPHARFDITAGVSSAREVGSALQLSDIRKQVVAMRWIADIPNATRRDGSKEEVKNWFADKWMHVSQVVHGIMRAQWSTDIKLVSLHINDHYRDRDDDWEIVTTLLDTLRDIIPGSIHTLSINFSTLPYIIRNEAAFFKEPWPLLRRFFLDSMDENPEEDELLGLGPDPSWVSAHPNLENIDIFAPFGVPALSLVEDFPRLSSVALRGCDPGAVGAFLHRHGHKLIELELPKFVAGGGLRAAIRPELVLPNLRILRAPPRVAAALIDGQHAPQLAHIELGPVQVNQELMLTEWILPDSEAGRRITCLDVEFKRQTLRVALNELGGSIFNPERLPSLVELSLCSTYICGSSSSFDSTVYLWDIVLWLLNLPSLRALRIEQMELQPLPEGEPMEKRLAHDFMKLEYLTWHSPLFNRTQYYRVIRQPSGEPNMQPYGRPPPILLKFQRLPASFRALISD